MPGTVFIADDGTGGIGHLVQVPAAVVVILCAQGEAADDLVFLDNVTQAVVLPLQGVVVVNDLAQAPDADGAAIDGAAIIVQC